MTLTPIQIDPSAYPRSLRPLLTDAPLYDSSCSEVARVTYIAKDNGYFLKSAPAGSLYSEAKMTHYFYEIGMAAKVLAYIMGKQDWLLTEKIPGDDCISAKYLEDPTRLCDTLAEILVRLHCTDPTGCPVNYTKQLLAKAERNMQSGDYDKSHFPDSFGYSSEEEAWAVVEAHGHLLQEDTLLHGDYCLPNVILDNWRFSGFIDLDCAGRGDRHVDLFWVFRSLEYNLKSDKYRWRFIDAYGRDKVCEDMLRVVAAVEVFG